ncbi:MAG: response regulator, partial [Bacteroidetes bacterium]
MVQNGENTTDIVIVDDHQIVIDGLRSLLEGADGLHIVATTNHPTEALNLIEIHKPHILLTDVMMPE